MGTGKSPVRVGTVWPPFEMPGEGPEMSSGDLIRMVPEGRRNDQKKNLKEKKGCCHILLMSQSKLNPPAAPSAICVVNLPMPVLKRSTRVMYSGLGRLDLKTQTI